MLATTKEKNDNSPTDLTSGEHPDNFGGKNEASNEERANENNDSPTESASCE